MTPRRMALGPLDPREERRLRKVRASSELEQRRFPEAERDAQRVVDLAIADGDQFDRNWYDYDIVTEAVLAVLAAKPASPVGVLADGTVPLTAFVPNDRAFQSLVADLAGSRLSSEKAVFEAVAGLGIDTVETVLLYHVVPGATITSKQAIAANGAVLTTAQGGTITVRSYSRYFPIIELRDKDTDDRNPFVNPFALDLNKGNKQIAHGITDVLRPVNL